MESMAGEPKIDEIGNLDEFNDFVTSPGVRIVKFYLKDCGPCRLLSPTFRKLAAVVPAAQVLLNNFKKSDFPHISKAPLVEVYKDGQIFVTFSGKQLTYREIEAGIKEAESGRSS